MADQHRGNQTKKVRSGDSLSIPASTWNRLLGMLQQFDQQQANQKIKSRWASRQGSIIPVRNDSGSDRTQFDILGVDEPLILPSLNDEAFAESVALIGLTPSTGGGTSPNHAGRFVILLEPIPTGDVGMACVAGACQVDVYVNDVDDTTAEVADGQTGYLTSGTDGSAVILWKQAGTGQRPAVVRIGGGGSSDAISSFPAQISASLGSGAYTAKEQQADGAGALTDKDGASNITIYNLAEEGTVSSKSVCKVNTFVMITPVGNYYWFERATNAQYRES